jgi:two-component sensor histidine kinase
MDSGDTIVSFLGKLEVINSQHVNLGNTSLTDPSLIVKELASLSSKYGCSSLHRITLKIHIALCQTSPSNYLGMSFLLRKMKSALLLLQLM